MRIAIFGTFDVDNFGDLLFPIIAQRELTLRSQNIEIVPYSYHETLHSRLGYHVRSLDTLDDDINNIDGFLIGGGHLIRFDESVAPNYAPSTPQIPHPLGYWLSPALTGIASGLPVTWNAPGASYQLPQWGLPLLVFALERSKYVSVRDADSLDMLRQAGYRGPAHVVPDTAHRIGTLIPSFERKEYVTAVKKELDISRPYLIVQANSSIVSALQYMVGELNLNSVLDVLVIPVGPSLGDSSATITSRFSEAKSMNKWPDPIGLAGLVAHSVGVVCHSLHLSIVALSYGLPVLRPHEYSGGKYTSLKASPDVLEFNPNTTDGVVAFFKRTSSPQPIAYRRDELCDRALLDHWDHIARIFLDKETLAKRNAFSSANLLLRSTKEAADQSQPSERRTQSNFPEETSADETNASLPSGELSLAEIQPQFDGTRSNLNRIETDLAEVRQREEELRRLLDSEITANQTLVSELALARSETRLLASAIKRTQAIPNRTEARRDPTGVRGTLRRIERAFRKFRKRWLKALKALLNVHT